jgi:putative addiction module killer protein
MKIKRTKEFDKWFKKLRDNKFKKKIANRFHNITLGNFGDCKRLDEFLWELRFKESYRIYYIVVDEVVIIFGGSKDTQTRDIIKAKHILQEHIK